MSINYREYTDRSYFIKEIEADPLWICDFEISYHEYRNKWKRATEDLKLLDFPLCLEVESSYSCNFLCPNCPRFAASVPRHGIMTLDTFSKMIRECKKMKLDSIFLDHGGEPLINKSLPQFVALCRDAGIQDIMISTNASLLTKELSRELIENGLTKINFSIDAVTSETYAQTRPGGNYHETIKNIEAFLTEKEKKGNSYPRVRVSFIIQRANEHEIDLFFELWEKRVNVIAFQTVKNFKKILDESLIESSVQDCSYNCTQVFTTLMIDYMGDIHPCNHDYNHKYVLGNVHNGSIEKCWHSDYMKNLRSIHKQGLWKTVDCCRSCVLGCL